MVVGIVYNYFYKYMTINKTCIFIPYHHHLFKVRFSILAWVGLLPSTAFGSQLYKTQPLLKAPGFKTRFCLGSQYEQPTVMGIMVHVPPEEGILQADALPHKPTLWDGVFLTRHTAALLSAALLSASLLDCF